MYIGDITDFVEHFSSYLNDGEDISVYTIEANTGITITADALDSPDINYTVQADGASDGSGISLLNVKIVATPEDGRIETRIINFKILSSDID